MRKRNNNAVDFSRDFLTQALQTETCRGEETQRLWIMEHRAYVTSTIVDGYK